MKLPALPALPALLVSVLSLTSCMSYFYTESERFQSPDSELTLVIGETGDWEYELLRVEKDGKTIFWDQELHQPFWGDLAAAGWTDDGRYYYRYYEDVYDDYWLNIYDRDYNYLITIDGVDLDKILKILAKIFVDTEGSSGIRTQVEGNLEPPEAE